MSSRALAPIVIACVAALSTACTGSTAPSTPPTTQPAISPSTPTTTQPAISPSTPRSPLASASVDLDALGAFVGTYTTTIPSGVNAAPGDWRLMIDEGGLIFTHPAGDSFNPGDVLAVTPSEIVLAPAPDCPGQQGGTPTEGRYRWSLDGNRLTFELESDSCPDRADTLTISEWSLTP